MTISKCMSVADTKPRVAEHERLDLMAPARALTLVYVTLVAFHFAGSAQAAPSNLDLARQLVGLLKYERQMEAYQEQCINNAKSLSPESLAKESPEKYSGITPSSRHWPKVVEAYEQYWRELCARPTVQEFLDAMALVYAKEMSVSELKRAIAFYSTETGQRLIEGHRKVSSAVNALVSQVQATEVPKAMGKFDRRVEEIAREAEADKKCPPPREMRSNRASEGARASCGPRAAQRQR